MTPGIGRPGRIDDSTKAGPAPQEAGPLGGPSPPRPRSAAISLTALRATVYHFAEHAGVMKRQTCQTQNLVGGNLRKGSSPFAGRSMAARGQEVRFPAQEVEHG